MTSLPSLPGPDGRPARGGAARIVLGVVLVAFIAFAAYWLASPYLAVQRMVQAAKAGDAASVARQVDFPAVRAGLRPQIAAAAGRSGASTGLAAVLAPLLAGSALDQLVTPETLAQVIRTGRTPGLGLRDGRHGVGGAGQAQPVHLAYVGGGIAKDFTRFDAVIADRTRPQNAVTLEFARRGLFDWVLVGVQLPGASGQG